jgi:hypothetical protein
MNNKHKLNNTKLRKRQKMKEITLLICRNVYNAKLDDFTSEGWPLYSHKKHNIHGILMGQRINTRVGNN